MLGLVVAAHRFAAGAGGQRGKNADRHAMADEADRAVTEESIYAAGVEAVDLAGAIHAVVRVRIGAAGVFAVGAIDAAWPRYEHTVCRRSRQPDFTGRARPSAAVDRILADEPAGAVQGGPSRGFGHVNRV